MKLARLFAALAALGIASCSPAPAAEIAATLDPQAGQVTLTDEPCTLPTLPAQTSPSYFYAYAESAAQPARGACWRFTGSQVLVLFFDGDFRLFEAQEFALGVNYASALEREQAGELA